MIPGIVSFVLLALLVYFFPPSFSFSFLISQISILNFFFVLLFLFLYFTAAYILNSKKHALLIGLFAVSYLLLRINGLVHPFFLILLLGIFFMLELLFSYKK